MYNIGNQHKIMRKLLGKSTVEASSDNSLGVTSSPLAPHSYRSNVSQNAVYPAGSPINCIDASPDGYTAVLAGRHMLRTVTLDGVTVREGVDLRAIITAPHTLRTNAPSSVADQLSIKDVKWGSVQGNASIFTGCASGRIFQYDLTTISSSVVGGPSNLDIIQMREDSRQINTLDINPHRGTWLLSGSQDGLVRCFDIRVPIQTRTGLSFRSVQAFKCNAEGVRKVQWSPKDGFVFACGTEQGVVLRWDIRKPTGPTLRINAHEKVCTTIAWHPDGEHLMTGGSDSKCHVWDLSRTADKRQKPKWVLSTPAPVAAVAWRPGQWSATAQAKRAAQVAVSYDDSSQKRIGMNSVHIWDLARPTMPFREVQRFDSSPSAMLWHDQDLLWTVGQDGLFNQCDIAFAPRVIDRQPVSALAFSSHGDVAMLLDERSPSDRRPRHSTHPDNPAISSYSSSPTAPMLSVSRSDSEDDVLGSFLARRKAGRTRRPSTRSAIQLSTTPPTAAGNNEDKLLSLDQAIKVTGTYRPQQAMAIGHAPAAAKTEVYEFLSVNYLGALLDHLPMASSNGKSLVDRVGIVLEKFAQAAEQVSLFRLAQTWRILAFGMSLLLKSRGQYHFEQRMDNLRIGQRKKSSGKTGAPNMQFHILADKTTGDTTPRKALSSVNLDKLSQPRSYVGDEFESTSNVPTPLARPVADESDIPGIEDAMHGTYIPPKKLTPIIEPESFTRGAAFQLGLTDKRKRLDSEPISVTSQGSSAISDAQASTDGYDFYDTEAITHAIDVPLPRQSTPPLPAYGQIGSASVRRRMPAIRQDSDESFAQMFSISDGSRQTTNLESPHDSVSSYENAAGPSHKSTLHTTIDHFSQSGSETGASESRSAGGSQMDELADNPTRLPFQTGLRRSETNMTAYTDEHHLITQTTSDSFESQEREFPSQPSDFDDGTSFPGEHASAQEMAPPVSPSDEKSPFVIETDYLHWSQDPPYPYPVLSIDIPASSSPALQPYSIISRALSFEVKSSALNASAMVLLLKPLVSDDVIDPLLANSILRQHHTRLMSMKLFVEAALLRKLCMKGWPGDLLSDWGTDYTQVFSPAQQRVKAHFLCPICRKPRDIDRSSGSSESIWCCQKCKYAMAACAICGHRDATPNLPPAPLPTAITNASKATESEPIMATWWYCPTCGHGGHSTCLQAWHSPDPSESSPEYTDNEYSGGYCPLDGCGHACVPGRTQAEAVVSRAEEVVRAVNEAARAGSGQLSGLSTSRRGHSGSIDLRVHSDGHEVAQSKAVESVRETLAFGGGSHSSSPGRQVSLSPAGRSGEGKEKERERRKSVKFLAAEDKR